MRRDTEGLVFYSVNGVKVSANEEIYCARVWMEGIFRSEVVVFDKIFNFYQNQQLTVPYYFSK